MKKPSIMLDAGHGGQDPGALGAKLREKDVALAVVMLIGAQLIGMGIDVRYTRKDDTFVTLPRRAEMANEARVDLFLSMHCNSSNKPARGFEVFTTPGQTAADPFATELFKAYAAEFPTLPKRMDTQDKDPDKEASFAVLRLSKMPAALFELDFIHDPGGEEFLGNPVFQGRMAKALASAVRRTLDPAAAMAAAAEADVPVLTIATQAPQPGKTFVLPSVKSELRRLSAEMANLAERA